MWALGLIGRYFRRQAARRGQGSRPSGWDPDQSVGWFVLDQPVAGEWIIEWAGPGFSRAALGRWATARTWGQNWLSAWY